MRVGVTHAGVSISLCTIGHGDVDIDMHGLLLVVRGTSTRARC